MIKLYYVEGISLLDTPYFSNINEQEEYFENKLVKTIQDNSFYPPYYRNQISIDSEDATFLTQFNYVSLEYQNKIYYYFIEGINYDNEDLITLNILMDTIQTYMFNIIYQNYELSKKSIKRWIDNKINRDYIRENYSKGHSIVWKYDKENIDNNKQIIIVQCIQGLEDNDNAIPPIFNINDKLVGDNLVYYVLPSPNAIQDNDKITINNRPPLTSAELRNFINKVSQQPKVLNMIYAPYNYFENNSSNVTIENDVKILHINIPNVEAPISESDFFHDTCGIKLNNVEPIKLIHNITQEFLSDKQGIYRINNKLNEPFKLFYIPQLIDENYMQVLYGERLHQTTYPLSKLFEPMLYKRSIQDYMSGTRIYDLLNDINNEDVYLTRINVDTLETYALKNDAWQSYLSQNKATLTTGKTVARQQALFNALGGMIGAAPRKIQTGWKTTYNYSTIDRQPTSKVSKPTYGMGGGSTIGAASALAEGIWDLYSIDREYQITRENLEYTPDTLKSANELTSDLISETTEIITIIQYVSDFEDIGRILEGAGYNVHETYSYQDIFNISNIRYYYNVIQCSNINITLNMLNDEETLLTIKQRFLNGIRYWNYDSNTKDTYLPLGKICYYDNVEKDNIE